MQKLRKRWRTVRWRYAHALLAMLATAIFDHLFIKSNISAMDRLGVVKFHINKSYLDMLREAVFSGHGVKQPLPALPLLSTLNLTTVTFSLLLYWTIFLSLK